MKEKIMKGTIFNGIRDVCVKELPIPQIGDSDGANKGVAWACYR
jgi:hypothetical protein